MISILDFGSQYTQLICRRIRELGVTAEIVPYGRKIHKTGSIKGIILSGSPASLDKNSPPLPDKKIFSLGVPVLGICYGMQVVAKQLGGSIGKGSSREYGEARLKLKGKCSLFSGLPDRFKVWMSHYDRVTEIPRGFEVMACTSSIPAAAIGDSKRKIYAVQFHPEVGHTQHGMKILENFLFKICRVNKDWDFEQWIDSTVLAVKKQVGSGKVIMALSGGVDSSVAAVIIQKAVGKHFYPVFVDHGLIREKDTDRIKKILVAKMGIKVKIVEARQRFMKNLKGVSNPEKKRKIIGREFIRVFTAEAGKIKGITHLAQGTLYPDVIESAMEGTKSSKIKTHHNTVLPKNLKFRLIEPLRFLFKDEVREVGRRLGIPDEIIKQQPFPGPGLGVRIIGAVTMKKAGILRQADSIMEEELKAAGIYYRLWQSFPVFLPIRTVGVMGDQRTYENVIALRCVESRDAMTANWAKVPYGVLGKISTRIVNEVRGINRVVYDLTNKPPGTIEWE